MRAILRKLPTLAAPALIIAGLGFAPAAFAGDDATAQPVSAITAQRFAPEARVTAAPPVAKMHVKRYDPEPRITAQPAIAVMTVTEAAAEMGLTAVTAPDGKIYYNRNVEVAPLPDPQRRVEVVETFDVSHDGVVDANNTVKTVSE